MGLFKHFLFGFIPEMLLHTRSQGMSYNFQLQYFGIIDILTLESRRRGAGP
jgi:hypothetical protein